MSSTAVQSSAHPNPGSIAALFAGAPPEDQLILAAARRELDAASRASIAALIQGPLDWPLVVDQATEHAIAPLLLEHLHAVGHDHVPPAALDDLNRVTAENLRVSMLLTAELIRLLPMLAALGVEVIPFKGPALALSLYGSLTLRAFGDVDLLIHREHLPCVHDLLLSLGYNSDYPAATPNELRRLYRQRHECKFHGRSNTALVVDVQWKLLQSPFVYPRNIGAWWHDLRQGRLIGHSISQLSPERELMMLCIHGSKHMWERLIWLCDVAELLRRAPNLNWALIMREAHTSGASRMIRLGLTLAHALLAAPLPEEIIGWAYRDPELLKIAGVVRKLVYRRGELPDWYYQSEQIYTLQLLERPLDKLRVIARYGLSNPIYIYRKYGLAPLRMLFSRNHA